MADHPDPNYVCLNDPVCMNWWDGYYAPSHSARCAERNGQAEEPACESSGPTNG